MPSNIRPEEISTILKRELENFERGPQSYEVGTVLKVGDGIARVHGLYNIQAGELVQFADGTMGMALNLEEDNVGIAIFGEDIHIKEGQEVKRTQKIASVQVGEKLTGRIVDALGIAIDGGCAN